MLEMLLCHLDYGSKLHKRVALYSCLNYFLFTVRTKLIEVISCSSRIMNSLLFGWASFTFFYCLWDLNDICRFPAIHVFGILSKRDNIEVFMLLVALVAAVDDNGSFYSYVFYNRELHEDINLD